MRETLAEKFPSVLPESVTVRVSAWFFDEARPWYEDHLGYGDEIVVEVRGGRTYLTMSRDVGLDLLDFADHGAEGFSRNGGMDIGGDRKETYRYGALYRRSAKSIREQLMTVGKPK